MKALEAALGDESEAGRLQPRRHPVPERPGGEPGGIGGMLRRDPAPGGKHCSHTSLCFGDPAEARRRPPRHRGVPEWSAHSYTNFGNLLIETGQPAKALSRISRRLAIQRKLASQRPEAPELASGVGLSLNNIAAIDLDAKRFGEARDRLARGNHLATKGRRRESRPPVLSRVAAFSTGLFVLGSPGPGRFRGRSSKPTVRSRSSAIPIRGSWCLNCAAGRYRQGAGTASESSRAARSRPARTARKGSVRNVRTPLGRKKYGQPRWLGNDLAAQHQYNAACAAWLAGWGRPKDDPPLDEAAKAKYRKQALEWLKAEHAVWSKLLESDAAKASRVVAEVLAHWERQHGSRRYPR